MGGGGGGGAQKGGGKGCLITPSVIAYILGSNTWGYFVDLGQSSLLLL